MNTNIMSKFIRLISTLLGFARISSMNKSRFFVQWLTIYSLLHMSKAQHDRGGAHHRITWGRGNPHTSAVFGDTPTNVTAVVGHRARLPCQVRNLGHKDVSWIRQRDIHILTAGLFTYTSDDRFKVYHPPDTEFWYLDISSVTFRDIGIYECQISTSPKIFLPVNLEVLGIQQARIPGAREMYIRVGSTISLMCEVAASSAVIGNIQWLHGPNTLNYSSPRGGISLELEKTPSRTSSKLYITRARKVDSGNYTCGPQFANSDSVIVHVVNEGEESAAAVQSRGFSCIVSSNEIISGQILILVLFFFNFLNR